MFKKAFKIAMTFALLMGMYAGYTRLFAIVAVRAMRSRGAGVALLPSDSRTKKEAIALAARAFGSDDWSAKPELPGRYYNKERGYWMYYKEYERLSDGKQFRFKPFAVILQSHDKKALKTITSDEAIVDLDRPLGLAVNKPGTPPMRVIHAQITGNVRIRDDKGTANPGDDMFIGPMPYMEYDEATLQLRSDSDVVIQDHEMWVQGQDMLIQLRAKEGIEPGTTSTGFDGAKTAYLRKNVHIILHDAGRSGILPGSARTDQTDEGRTPVDLRSAGEMQIDLPKPRLPVKVGPPAPPDPTIANFSRDVVVLRGKLNQTPDQLNCDHLKLTLLPGDKPPPGQAAPESKAGAAAKAGAEEGTPEEPEAAGGSLGGLTLRRPDATGHAVWLQSVSEGTKARCNELIYKKLLPERPDETYLRGDMTTKLWVEKLDIAQDGPNKGQITSVMTIRTIDATIFNSGQSRNPETIVARGPGILETRPAKDKPVERRAIWQDQLVMQDEIRKDGQLRKRITLTGDPKFIDVAQATLDAKKEIIVWLKPKPAPATPDAAPNAPANGPISPPSQPQTPAQAQAQAQAQAPAQTAPGSGKFDIETLRAIEDVHLTAPGRLMTARNVLFAVFETQPVPAPAPGPAGAPPANNTNPSPSETSGPPVANPETQSPALQGEAKVEAKPTEPDVNVQADRVWARIGLKPAAEQGGATRPGSSSSNPGGTQKTRSEILEARLRGSVFFHQDPEPGKERGTNVSGEAIDVANMGENRMAFKVFLVDPQKVFPLAPNNPLVSSDLLTRIKAVDPSIPLARVETNDFTIEGPIIGLNQLTDEAWTDGRGTLVQLAPRGLLSDKGLDNRKAQTQTQGQDQTQTPGKAQMSPLKISWTDRMQFKGRSTNPKGIPVARAQFFGNVCAENEESLMLCQEMISYMDRVIQLNRPKRDKAATPGNGNLNGNGNGGSPEAAEPEPKPQIALIDCLHEVHVDNRKIDRDSDPETPTLLERQVIEGDHVIYDKLTGNYLALPPDGGWGVVYLYGRDGQNSLANPAHAGAGAGGRSDHDREPADDHADGEPVFAPAPNTRRATEVVGRNTNPLVNPATAKTKARVRAKAAELTEPSKPLLAPLKLTQIIYSDEMHGRFGSGKDSDTTETRWADFFGFVQVLHAEVFNENVTFDYDNRPPDYTFLTAQTVRVVSEPPPPGTTGAARNFLKAWENATAETSDTTIQSDKITYDSLKGLFYAYGENGRQVFLVQQKTAGQPAQNTTGNAAWYNRLTGESQIVDPMSIQLVDAKYGVRPGAALLVDLPKKRKKPLTAFKGPARAYFERKGFNGR